MNGWEALWYALEKLTGFPVFHNHMTIELVLPFFRYGTPPFQRLVNEFRFRIFEEVAQSDLPGFTFTYVWALDEPEDKRFVDRMAEVFTARGAEVCYVELASSQSVRLKRNETEFRLSQKPSKRNVEWSRSNLLQTDARYRMNTEGDFFYPDQYLRIDNTAISPEQAAEQIVRRFNLSLKNQQG